MAHSVLFNSSLVVFNPYTNNITERITFPGLTGDSNLHLGPALPDENGDLIVLFDAAAPFASGGANLTGNNYILKYSLTTKKVLWQRDINAEVTQGKYSGFQDVEYDENGNVYIVGTFPGTILRVDTNGNGLAPWYLPSAAALANTTVAGFSGLAIIRQDDLLLTNNNADGQVYRFDGVSGSVNGTPVLVPRTDTSGNAAAPLSFTDAILLPAKYNNTILLLADNANGTVVLRSRDAKWTSAETLGIVSNNVADARGGFITANVQIGPEKIFSSQAFFTDEIVAGTNAGNRTEFPFVDVTAEVDALLKKFP